MTMKSVNRIAIDGTTVTATLGRLQLPLTKASYSDALETEELRRMGEQIIAAVTPGAYKPGEISLEMSSADFRSLLVPAMQTDGFGLEQIALVITETHPDLGTDSDLIDGFRFTNLSSAHEASATVEKVEIKGKCVQVYWGDERKTINKRNMALPLTASGF
jgi:hypothetical protein